MKCEDFSTPEGAIKSGAEECGNASAVYFLYKDGELAYIGQSVNPFERIRRHNISGWDQALALPTDIDKMEEVESMMIASLQPPWNRVGVDPENRQERDDEIRMRCSKQQHAIIKAKADKIGLSISAYVRMVALEAAS